MRSVPILYYLLFGSWAFEMIDYILLIIVAIGKGLLISILVASLTLISSATGVILFCIAALAFHQFNPEPILLFVCPWATLIGAVLGFVGGFLSVINDD